MTAEDLWRRSGLTGIYEVWAFGEAPDKLASLVKDGMPCFMTGNILRMSR